MTGYIEEKSAAEVSKNLREELELVLVIGIFLLPSAHQGGKKPQELWIRVSSFLPTFIMALQPSPKRQRNYTKSTNFHQEAQFNTAM